MLKHESYNISIGWHYPRVFSIRDKFLSSLKTLRRRCPAAVDTVAAESMYKLRYSRG
jgi:hypothetical protein